VHAVDYIISHIHSRILLDDTAEYLKISPAYLSRLFKQETGVAFSEYVNNLKIEEAASLLLFTEYSDLEISNLLAFSSQSYFIKVFRKQMGLTPKQYKKQYKILDF
ncbi:MAG: AraC family transcriptional regulator, partial [Ruminococcus sp.]|nr:AraC family transcriptional regulator [Ruminococcus sp.]